MTVGRVLVTGATGFIGRWSVPALLRLGYEVHAVTSGTGAPAAQADAVAAHGGKRASWHAANLLDGASIERIVDAVRPSHLLHFAWIATPGVYSTSADNERWRRASECLFDRFVAAGGRRIVAAGSCAEYDWTQAGVCHETTTPLVDPDAPRVTPYAAAKRRLSSRLTELDRSDAVAAAWGRIFFQFGPFEHPERLVASVIGRLLQGLPADCTPGSQIRSFLHVADVGEAFVQLLDSGVRGPVNVGSAQRVSVAELVRLIARQAGHPELIRLGARAAPPDEPALLVPSLARLHAEVGWRPRFTLDSAVADTLAWHRARAAS